jgi:hypothetical protein
VEEFAVLLPDCGLDDAMQIAERLRTAQPEVTCSLGVADWDGREDATELVARADRALYAAKAAGRNRSFAAPGATAASAARAPDELSPEAGPPPGTRCPPRLAVVAGWRWAPRTEERTWR